jgi:hypothetical protein
MTVQLGVANDSQERIGRPREMRAMVPATEQRRLWRAELAEAEQRYTEDQNAGNRAEYMRILRIFKDLVLYDRVPPELPRGSKACPRCLIPLDCKVTQRSVFTRTSIQRPDVLMQVVSIVVYSCHQCGYWKLQA